MWKNKNINMNKSLVNIDSANIKAESMASLSSTVDEVQTQSNVLISSELANNLANVCIGNSSTITTTKESQHTVTNVPKKPSYPKLDFMEKFKQSLAEESQSNKSQSVNGFRIKVEKDTENLEINANVDDINEAQSSCSENIERDGDLQQRNKTNQRKYDNQNKSKDENNSKSKTDSSKQEKHRNEDRREKYKEKDKDREKRRSRNEEKSKDREKRKEKDQKKDGSEYKEKDKKRDKHHHNEKSERKEKDKSRSKHKHNEKIESREKDKKRQKEESREINEKRKKEKSAEKDHRSVEEENSRKKRKSKDKYERKRKSEEKQRTGENRDCKKDNRKERYKSSSKKSTDSNTSMQSNLLIHPGVPPPESLPLPINLKQEMIPEMQSEVLQYESPSSPPIKVEEVPLPPMPTETIFIAMNKEIKKEADVSNSAAADPIHIKTEARTDIADSTTESPLNINIKKEVTHQVSHLPEEPINIKVEKETDMMNYHAVDSANIKAESMASLSSTVMDSDYNNEVEILPVVPAKPVVVDILSDSENEEQTVEQNQNFPTKKENPTEDFDISSMATPIVDRAAWRNHPNLESNVMQIDGFKVLTNHSYVGTNMDYVRGDFNGKTNIDNQQVNMMVKTMSSADLESAESDLTGTVNIHLKMKLESGIDKVKIEITEPTLEVVTESLQESSKSDDSEAVAIQKMSTPASGSVENVPINRCIEGTIKIKPLNALLEPTVHRQFKEEFTEKN